MGLLALLLALFQRYPQLFPSCMSGFFSALEGSQADSSFRNKSSIGHPSLRRTGTSSGMLTRGQSNPRVVLGSKTIAISTGGRSGSRQHPTPIAVVEEGKSDSAHHDMAQQVSLLKHEMGVVASG
eukprot:2388571-Prymnesium_polylepis.2